MLIAFIKAVIIGLAVTIPMGPVGILCIQQTINKGRWAGLFTGIGSTLSDIFYAGVALFSLSFVSDFLDRNRIWVMLIGGVIVAFFGIWTSLANPVKQFGMEVPGSSLKTKDGLTAALKGFAMTITNPGALVMMLGAFAFAGIDPETAKDPLSILVMVGGVAAGTALWWLTLSGLVSRLRKYFRVRGMIILNVVSGIIIAVIGAGAIVLALSEIFAK